MSRKIRIARSIRRRSSCLRWKGLREEILADADPQAEGSSPSVETSASSARPPMPSIGTPAWSIVEYAGSHDIDLIVMGTHGRGGMSHLLMGSVAERVVRTAPCPVLTVRQSRTARPATAECTAGGGHGSAAGAHGDNNCGQAVLTDGWVRLRRHRLLDGEAELLDAVPHLVAIDAEELSRLRLIPAGSLERLHEQLTLDLVEADALGRQLEFARA